MSCKALTRKTVFPAVEQITDGLPDIGKGCTGSERDRADVFAVDQKRRIFTGMVGARRAGITPVIGGDNERVILAELLQKSGQPRIKIGKAACVSRNVITVTPQLIEVNEIDKAQSAEILTGKEICRRHTLGITVRQMGLRDAASEKDIGDLADRDDIQSRMTEHVEHGVSRRRKREVAAVFGTVKMPRLTGKRARNDAGNTVLTAQKPARGTAVGIQRFGRDDILVCRDLEHTVGRCVNDQIPRQHMCLAEALDALRAGIRLITQNPAPGNALKRL